MSQWREAFESRLAPAANREYGEEYIFGPPASEEEIKQAEEKRGFRFPDELRELLQEINGIWCSTIYNRELGHPPAQLFWP